MSSQMESRESVWGSMFDAGTRHDLQEQDRIAGQTITGILLTIFSAGLLLAIFTVWIALS